MGTPPAPRVTGIRTVFANEGAVAAATSAAVSSTLFMGPSCARESRGRAASSEGGFLEEGSSPCAPLKTKLRGPIRRCERDCQPGRKTQMSTLDRKSTRLNSSHLVISYAVFCLKKKIELKHSPQHFINHELYIIIQNILCD